MNSHLINFLPARLHLIGRIPLSSSYQDIRTEPKYIVFLTKLLLLFQFCHVCRTGSKPETTAEQAGTGIVIKTVCTNSNCRKEFIWSSQPFMPGTKILAGNFLIQYLWLCYLLVGLLQKLHRYSCTWVWPALH